MPGSAICGAVPALDRSDVDSYSLKNVIDARASQRMSLTSTEHSDRADVRIETDVTSMPINFVMLIVG
ncbi:hypothetical protein D1006_33115 [Burkholderia stabilis]|uniref:Uncharacterized protein n=2 Tax=Burkholderia stabilis TaxID=95485 RepID=A0A4Q2A8P1_9BURK|nr:hypothetical protein D1006_33115 [Burkholderia stabilis]